MRCDGALLRILSLQIGFFFFWSFFALLLFSCYCLGECVYAIFVDNNFPSFVGFLVSLVCLALFGFLSLSQIFLIYYGLSRTNWKVILVNFI